MIDVRKRKEYKKQYYQKNKKRIKEKHKEYRSKNKEKIKEYHKQYYQSNKEKRKEKVKQYNQDNKERLEEYSEQYYQNNKEKIKEYYKWWFQNNKEKKRGYNNKYAERKRKTDSKFKLNHNISVAIYHSLKGNKNGNHWEDIVGYTLDDLMEHLESTSNCTIQDYLEKNLHIDHIIPISAYSFNSYEDEEFKKCWNLRNLRIIIAKENFSKSNILCEELVEEYNIKDLLPNNLDKK